MYDIWGIYYHKNYSKREKRDCQDYFANWELKLANATTEASRGKLINNEVYASVGRGEHSLRTSRHGLLSNGCDCVEYCNIGFSEQSPADRSERDGFTCWITEMNFSLSMMHSVGSCGATDRFTVGKVEVISVDMVTLKHSPVTCWMWSFSTLCWDVWWLELFPRA